MSHQDQRQFASKGSATITQKASCKYLNLLILSVCIILINDLINDPKSQQPFFRWPIWFGTNHVIVVQAEAFGSLDMQAAADATGNYHRLSMPNGSSCVVPPNYPPINIIDDTKNKLRLEPFRHGLNIFAPQQQTSNLTPYYQLMHQSDNTVQLYQGNSSALVVSNPIQLAGSSNSNRPIQVMSQAQIVFESICSGWKNSLQPNFGPKQAAYWIFDRLRGVFVVRLDFYSIGDYVDSPNRKARLSSPIFRPLPKYHLMPNSSLYKKCQVRFRSYVNIRAHLDLEFVPIQTVTSSSSNNNNNDISINNNQSQMSPSSVVDNQQQQQQSPSMSSNNNNQNKLGSYSLKSIVTKAWSLKSGRPSNEQGFWESHSIVMPTDAKYLHIPYRLEFTAIASGIGQENFHNYTYINGIAIANMSLSPECFAMQTSFNRKTNQIELRHINTSDPLTLDDYEDYQKLTRTGSAASKFNELRHMVLYFVEVHRNSIILGIIVIIMIIFATTQWLVCAQLCRPSKKPMAHVKYSQNNATFIEWLMDICCCCLCCCCWRRCLPSSKHRVYQQQQQQKSINGKYHHNSGCINNQNKLAESVSPAEHQRRLASNQAKEEQFLLDRRRNNYLRPLSATIFEHVELNENPNYLSGENGLLLVKTGWGLGAGSATDAPSLLTGGGGTSQMYNGSVANTNLSTISDTAKIIQQQQSSSLEPYTVDRSRLTLTRPLGKGAFGEVYQGYLLCHCNEDGKTLATRQQLDSALAEQHLDSLESHSMKVAVKTLTDERMSQSDFFREAINMSLVKHRNIVELIGVCFDEKPLYIIMELLDGGNLKNFLLKNRDKSFNSQQQLQQPIKLISLSSLSTINTTNTTNINNNNNLPSVQTPNANDRTKLCMGDLLVYALDIARACDYLQKRQFIHRDLAARNCLLTASVRNGRSSFVSTPTLGSNNYRPTNDNTRNSMRTFVGSPPSALDVDANHRVDLEQVYLNGFQDSAIVAKLADFGMTRDVNLSDYYRMVQKELPVRWMPPECLDGVATSKSDVWSFGVFLWELFSMGQMPYQNLLNNHEVIEFIKSRRLGKQVTNKQQSANCHKSPSSFGCNVEQQQQQQQQSPLLPKTCDINNNRPNDLINDQASYHHQQGVVDLHQQLAGPPATLAPSTISATSSQHPLIESSRQMASGHHQHQHQQQQSQQQQQHHLSNSQLSPSPMVDVDAPPLPMPHDNTPHPIYAIMCACWATNPEDRPQFEEIANRIYWCLQMPDVLSTSLPCFYEQQTPNYSTTSAFLQQHYNNRHQQRAADRQSPVSSSASSNDQNAIYADQQQQLQQPHLDYPNDDELALVKELSSDDIEGHYLNDDLPMNQGDGVASGSNTGANWWQA